MNTATKRKKGGRGLEHNSEETTRKSETKVHKAKYNSNDHVVLHNFNVEDAFFCFFTRHANIFRLWMVSFQKHC